MNWGHKIALVIGLFVVAMMTMVVIAFRQTNEMIDQNYYDKELKYQTFIDAGQRLSSVSTDRLVVIDSSGLYIKVPVSLATTFQDGTIEMLKVDDKSKDQNISFEVDNTGKFYLDKNKLVKGRYLLRIFWQSDGKSYYKEETLYNN